MACLEQVQQGSGSPAVSLISGPCALWPVRSGLREPVALVYSLRFNSLSQRQALGSESTTLPTPPCVKTDSTSVCCRNSTVDVEKPQTVLLVLASPIVQMVRDKWRRRKRSDQLKRNVILSRSMSPFSEAANCSLWCASGWVPGGRLLPARRGLLGCSRLAKVSFQHCPGVRLGIPVGDSPTGGLSGRFYNPFHVLSATSTSSNPPGQQDYSSTGGGIHRVPQVCTRGFLSRLPCPIQHWLLLSLLAPSPQEFPSTGLFLHGTSCSWTAAAQASTHSPAAAFSTAHVAHRAGEISPCSLETGLVRRGKQMLYVVGVFPESVWWGWLMMVLC